MPKTRLVAFVLAFCLLAAGPVIASGTGAAKPSPAEIQAWLAEGNARFAAGKPENPHTDLERLGLSGKESQADYARATVLSCSDSRLPVERLFDVGVMDVFVIRVAGNVANTDEIGSIEYGLLHVNTPLLVVLGHSQCGAVTAVTQAALGHGHPLERNIPPLVAPIGPAVAKVMAENPGADEQVLVDKAITANVWQVMHDLFMASPAVREAVKSGKAAVAGALYDVGTGKVEWLDAARPAQILAAAEADPARAMNAMYEAPAEEKIVEKGEAKVEAVPLPAQEAAPVVEPAPAPAPAKPAPSADLGQAMARLHDSLDAVAGVLAKGEAAKLEELSARFEGLQKDVEAKANATLASLAEREKMLEKRLSDATSGSSSAGWLAVILVLAAVVLLLGLTLPRIRKLEAKVKELSQQ